MATRSKAPARRRPSRGDLLDVAVRTALADAPEAPAGTKPDEKRQAPATPRLGTHGQNYNQGVLEEEWNSELSDWETRVGKLDELRRGDSVVASILSRLLTPILRATWTVEAGEDVTAMPGAEAKAPTDQAKDPLAKNRPQVRGESGSEDLDEPEPADATDATDATDAGDEADDQAVGTHASAELAAKLLAANLLGIGPAEYRMRTPWSQVLTEAFTAQSFGIAFLEVTRRVQKGPWGTFQIIDGLYFLHPRSITKLMIDRNGNLLGVLQEWKASFYDGTPDENAIAQEETVKKVLLSEDLVVITCDLEGSGYGANPRIRPMWLDAKRRNFLSQAQIVDAQKRAVGIPFVKLGANSQGEAKEYAITQAKRLREGGNELSYVVMMEGDDVGFLDMKANVPDLSEVIRSQESRMRSVAGQEQFALGQEGTGGSRAVASVNSAYFDLLIESIAESTRASFQWQLVEPQAAINTPQAPVPQLHVADIVKPNLGEVMQLAGGGGIKFTSRDEQHFRRIYKLPLLSAEEMQQRDEAASAAREQLLNAGLAPGGDGEDEDDDDPKAGPKGKPPRRPPPKPGAPNGQPPPNPKLAEKYGRGASVPGMTRKLWREPTQHEREYVRLADIEHAFDDFLRDFTQQIRALRDAAVLEALRKMRVRGKGVLVGRLRETALRDTMLELAAGLRDFGRQTARTEIQQQVHATRSIGLEDRDAADDFDPLAPVPSHPARARSRVPAAEVATELQEEFRVTVSYDVAQILDSVVKGIEREMLKALEEGMDEDAARDATRRALLGRSDVDVQRIGRGQATKSYSGGRAEITAQVRETLERTDAPVSLDYVVISEVMDDATCDTCEGLDGMRIEIDSDDYWSHFPGQKCEGGSNCRRQYLLIVDAKETR